MADDKARNYNFGKLQGFLKAVEAHATTPIDLEFATAMQRQAETVWCKLSAAQDACEASAIGDEAIKIQLEFGMKCEFLYINLVSKLRSIIDSLRVKPAVTTSATPTTTDTIRLPAMQLPEFDGSYASWTSFKDLFTAAVGSKTTLTGAQKLQFLKTTLRGDPAKLIAYLDTTDANYTEAWRILEERYANKRDIVHHMINKMLDLKPAKFESAKDLQIMMDQCAECLHNLKVMGIPVEKWDDMLVVILTRKLDPTTRRDWAKTLTGSALPTYKELQTFITSHIRGLEAAGYSRNAVMDRRGEKLIKVNHAATEEVVCGMCDGAHVIQECKQFLVSSPSERSAAVKKARLCFNCLRPGHMLQKCTSPRKCKKCGRRHHTLLHEEKATTTTDRNPKTSIDGLLVAAEKGALLMTAVIDMWDISGRRVPCRVLIDGGSEGDFMLERCRARLGMQRMKSRVTVKGFGNKNAGSSNGKVKTTLISSYHNNKLEVELLVVDEITGKLPKMQLESRWDHLKGLHLADEEWYKPAEVDILLGMKYHDKVMKMDRRRGPEDAPVAWETIFGWGIAGVCQPETCVGTYHLQIDTIDDTLRKFWEVEEPPKKRILTQEEKICEQHFLQHYKRDDNGRFVVGVPWKDEKVKELGKSREIAYKRLKQVERRLSRKPDLAAQYIEFMREYERLGHMTRVPITEETPDTTYLCHHFVVNESSSTKKLRVVFDGSAATSSGISLNDVMYVGATLHDDLYDMLLRFRVYAIVFKGDIKQMFRQFLLLLEDAVRHLILWRESPDSPLIVFRLNTVTYGTGYAPWLASRCLQQLGKDCATTHPEASDTLLNKTFVDDVMGGDSTVRRVIELYRQLVEACKTAGLELRKLCSNSKEVMEVIPEEHREANQVDFGNDELVKALGVQWNPTQDQFRFKPIVFQDKEETTKRLLLSELASVFDPLGLISCVTLRGKLLMQELWKLPLGWDEIVPESLHERWMQFKEDISNLQHIVIPRRITFDGAVKQEIHGFCDASEAAYGGIVYLRSIFPDGSVKVAFVTSKTRVAPVRQVTLPRLELCGAVLLAELVTHVRECLKLEADVFCWSDSTIALTWIGATPRRWKTYICNRVATIQELTLVSSWKHVAGVENPADLASRGCTVEALRTSEMWWQGPRWLSEPLVPEFPAEEISTTVDMEERGIVAAVAKFEPVEEHPLLTRFSSLNRLLRYTAIYFRFLLFRLKKKVKRDPISATEIYAARQFWIVKTQRMYFKDDISRLENGQQVGVKSKLKTFHPFIDKSGVLRVSGRLRHANIPDEAKHQIILPHESHLVDVIVAHHHSATHHGGFQLTWSTIQAEYLILRGRDKVRHFVRSCVRCRRFRAKAAQQLMGELPEPRVTPSRPVTHTGVDYAGPFSFKNAVGRVPKVYKGYMCVFICLVTKAVYLEAVSSLSTDAFLAAFRRFVSRRGLPAHLYSDCGTNFVGADKELQSFVFGSEYRDLMGKEYSASGVNWHFNPPSAPHFGGLWEAAVKSAKSHLRRVTSGGPMTFEHFATLLAQIEGVMNSRPLSAMSPDLTDFQPLTPGHFLIGAPLLAVPDERLEDIPSSRLNHHQKIQQQFQLFWKRWSSEYLHSLQQRTKWMWDKQNVKTGDLVLLVEESAPGTWKMGRVVEVHPGEDGKVRVATIKTATAVKTAKEVKTVITVLKRPIVKLVPLILEEN